LPQVGGLFEVIDALVVDVEEEVDKVEGLEDVADPPAAV